jgi:hypothetical protein
MRLWKSFDPTMALYAAYAYHDLRDHARIVDMQAHLTEDLGFQFFDIALLAGGLRGKMATRDGSVIPFAPMLSQGWHLLSAYGAVMPQALTGLERHTLPSLWTLFDRTGVEMAGAAMASGVA